MNLRFAEGAARLAGLVPRLMGWPPAAFWNATPTELAAILSATMEAGAAAPLSRRELEAMLERDRHG